ncbi:hypothetical protein KUTeg_016308 [Tegillarca granosa]|uniref:Uncharacterized protein n=1 Tax=Tegillarca granosa TaxID=220873 RepID=A0ABQ9EKH3_TEGGR|nr:hypothetical protein KUTeg_016308 [Tegillarca granosa]
MVFYISSSCTSWKAGVYLEFLEMTVEDARRNKLGTFSPNHAVEQLFPMEENITENGLVTLSYDERNASIPSEADIMVEIMNNGPVQIYNDK